ncbi:hypothetical protein M0R45_025888 [Rubus argutus]|uniref:Uncharacterized protein n=1 Tax=Rubus argutus TaxID=59490 RepID=A0AAW1WYG0_RUBAR
MKPHRILSVLAITTGQCNLVLAPQAIDLSGEIMKEMREEEREHEERPRVKHAQPRHLETASIPAMAATSSQICNAPLPRRRRTQFCRPPLSTSTPQRPGPAHPMSLLQSNSPPQAPVLPPSTPVHRSL